MKVLVIGSGLIGLTTAYFLKCRGHEVTVVDGESGPGRQTSFANGGLLSPSMPEPWNAPGCWRVLLASLGRSDTALKLRLSAVPGLTAWGITFLRNSSPALFERNLHSNLRLARYSLDVLRRLRAQTHLDYGGTARGSLRIFRAGASLEHAWAAVQRLAGDGLTFRTLSPAAAVELEPALAPIAAELAGAIHCPDDEAGDAWRFCEALAGRARERGVQFHFGTSIGALEVAAGRISGARTSAGKLVADSYVIAAGSYSTRLLRPMGLALPVQPVKGYSVTFDRIDGEPALGLPLADDDLHAVVTPLEGVIRAAGTAEFAGYDLTLRPERVRNLLGLVQRLLPNRPQLSPEKARAWCGLRPVSADGVPIIGATRIPNLLVNSGHGPLGWTMAAGSAQLLTDIVSENSPAIDPAPYAWARFG
ncbi:MAG TPA: D-amino acid dehydrogenase [Steroidobacteraceae bacterium]|jgi:D-amino-acid dehydrogenase|nr:D-amino acid dehydrogenase [Steroidobacteraceae bacterium]